MEKDFSNLIQYFRTQKKLADALNVKPQTVQAWIKGEREVPIKRCVSIEQLTHAAVTRKDLRPDDWQEVWPELRLETLLQKEIVESFREYGFTDRFGQSLENCADFLALVALAAKAK